MAGSVNKVILVGNLGKDPEIRRTQDGRPVANLSVATSDTWRDKTTGERRERTEWHRVVIFNEGLCRIAEQYLKKGSKVYLEGQLQTRKWQDQSGQDKYTSPCLTGRAIAPAVSSALRKMNSVPPARRRARRSRPWPAPASAATWTTRFRFDARGARSAPARAARFRQSRRPGGR